MSEKSSRSVHRFKQKLAEQGYSVDVMELPDSTRTARDAANAIGCTVSQIAKSLVFRGEETNDAFMAIVSGSNQADTGKLAKLAGEPMAKADADFVRAHTGYAIGGVPPLGLTTSVRTFIDADLLAFDHIWAAAGTPRAVCRLPAGELAAMTSGLISDIKQ